jgi:hypothetical protein
MLKADNFHPSKPEIVKVLLRINLEESRQRSVKRRLDQRILELVKKGGHNVVARI